MLKESLFICYSTPNYELLTTHFLESLSQIGVPPENIDHLIDTEVSLDPPYGFQSDMWYHCVKEKIVHLVKTLKKYIAANDSDYKYFIFSDCDIWFPKRDAESLWSELASTILEKDVYFMRENESDSANTGFFIIKNNQNLQKNIEFFERVISVMNICERSFMPLGDQTIINHFLSEIDFDYIPTDFVGWGTSIFNPSKMLLHHAVCSINTETKWNQIQSIKNDYQF
jgi:hypothetical protein